MISISGAIGGLTESAAYTYDNLGRLLTSNQTSNGSSAQRRFAYDPWGNRTGMWDAVSGGNQIQSIALQQSGSVPTNRIVSVTSGSTVNYTYDAAGNVTNDGLHAYAYDSENRIVSVDGDATASCAYDHQNRRYKKTVGSTVSHYVWEGGQVLARHDGSTGAVAMDYVYSGSRMVAKVGSGITQYFLSDRLSVRLSLDTSGNITGRQGHLPFGEDFAETGTQQKQHFTSYERDTEIGADYALNRQYGQGVGRFNRVDPVQWSARPGAPQKWNRYAYANNELLDQIDPTGLDGSGPCPAWEQFCDHGASGFSFSGQLYDGPMDGSCNSFTGEGCWSSPIAPPPARRRCSEQDFSFSQSSLVFTSDELSELAQMAVGEAGVGEYDQNEIEAVIATAINRLHINQAYLEGGANRGPFNGGTTIIGILQAGYDATTSRSGENKLNQAKLLSGGILYEDDYVCSQLKHAKAAAIVLSELPSDALFGLYPVTYNLGAGRQVPPGAQNKRRYGRTWFYFLPLPRP